MNITKEHNCTKCKLCCILKQVDEKTKEEFEAHVCSVNDNMRVNHHMICEEFTRILWTLGFLLLSCGV